MWVLTPSGGFWIDEEGCEGMSMGEVLGGCWGGVGEVLGRCFIFCRKTPRIYNRLAIVNTIAQVFHTGVARARYNRIKSPLPSQVSHNRTRQPRQPTSSVWAAASPPDDLQPHSAGPRRYGVTGSPTTA